MSQPSYLMTDAQLQALVAVADHGSFTAAARHLRTSQSAVSHAITGLEQSLGVTLLWRSARAVRLTEIGERTVAHAREVLAIKSRMRQEAEAARGLRRGTLRVGSFGASASRRLLPPILAAFARRYPDVAVVVSEGTDQEVEGWLRAGTIDVGFVTLPNDDLDTTPLWRDEYCALLPAGHPLAREPRVRPADLAHDPFVMSSGGCEPAVRDALGGTPVDVRFQIRETGTIVATVARGAGVSIVPTMSLPEPLPADVVVRPLDPPRPRSIALAVVKRTTASVLSRAFLKVAAAETRGAGVA
jgi:DNA-binding transcriptional LysR family regulator